MQIEIDKLIEAYFTKTVEATGLLYEHKHYAHLLVIIYSTVDALGLLNATPTQTEASGQSFKDWTSKYLIPNGPFTFNETDFWAARCSVLHTFTAESKLSQSGKAKQIQYYAGPKNTPQAAAIERAIIELENGAHVPANIDEIYLAFLQGIKNFASDLSQMCKSNEDCKNRLMKIIQENKF